MRVDNIDYISLTDLARYADEDEPRIPIQNWMRNKDVISYLGLWENINKNLKECLCDFWWGIEGDYFILFGEENKKIITFFIEECYNRDGDKEEIKRKLLKVGYKVQN